MIGRSAVLILLDCLVLLLRKSMSAFLKRLNSGFDSLA